MIKEHNDIFYIKHCLKLAKKGRGSVSPNPMVGAVIVKENQIIGEGYHKKSGEAHAEINALESVTTSPQGATLYCNLEPCCHENKKTAPCTRRIIKEGIQRVVISSIDPNPQVNGKGVEQLRKANVEVQTGILDDENRELNRFFFKYITQNRPYVTAKIAQTIDGQISLKRGSQKWITGIKSKKLVHCWRSEYDGLLVGARTVNIDNPELTVREVKGRNPYIIIVDGNLKVQLKNNIFHHSNNNKIIIFTSKNSKTEKVKKLRKKGCNIIIMPADAKGLINLDTILLELAKMNITSVLVEGGQQIFSQFIAGKFADEIKLFIAPQIWGKGLASIDFYGWIVKQKDDFIINNLVFNKIERSGEDILITLRWKKS
jgi:diaminohydroxyphosphoribosylaminopyrimidine deaminase/5-amino-6-(5-phosphoribosylamino)uracil reductase